MCCVLDNVSKYEYGHNSNDIDIWIMNNKECMDCKLKNDEKPLSKIYKLILCCDQCMKIKEEILKEIFIYFDRVVPDNTYEKLEKTNAEFIDSKSVMNMFSRKLNMELDIINLKAYNLSEIILEFDSPACQIGIQSNEHDDIEIICTNSFMECITTGIIHTWTFDRFRMSRIIKYKNKGFKFAENFDILFSEELNFEENSELISYKNQLPLKQEIINKWKYINSNSDDFMCHYIHKTKHVNQFLFNPDIINIKTDSNLLIKFNTYVWETTKINIPKM